jgi:hypothetical protein
MTILVNPSTRTAHAGGPEALPHELRMIPPDAAVFVHADVAAIYDSKLGDLFKKSASQSLKDKLAEMTTEFGVSLPEVKSITYALPNVKEPQDMTRGMVAVTFRKEYDRSKFVARLKAESMKSRAQFSEKDGIVRQTTEQPFKRTTITDLSDAKRIVILNDLAESHLKPPAEVPQGVHTAAIQRAGKEAFVAGLNFNALPDEYRMDNLPPEIRPLQPILKAESLTAIGTLQKETVNLSVSVRAKTKDDASEAEKALGAVQTLITVEIPQARKSFEKDLANPKEMSALLDVIEKSISAAKISLDDKVASASLSVPSDIPLGPFLELLSGGGASARMQSSNNLKQMALAMHNYHDAIGHFPPPAILDKKGKKLLSWRVAILPYIDQENLYKHFKLDEPWDSEHNKKLLQIMPKVYAMPGTKNGEEKKTHYQVFVGNGAMFEPVSVTKITDITDGSSNTILITMAATAVEWTKPDDIEYDPKVDMKKKLLIKDNGFQAVFGDGGVRFVRDTVAEKTLHAIITRAGGEVAEDDF